MKKLATKIEKGNEIQYGNSWGVVIEAPKQSTYKSNEVDILVGTLPQTIKRRDGHVQHYKGGNETTFSFRKTTMVKTR